MRKKFFTLVLLLVLMLGIASGCKDREPSSSGTNTSSGTNPSAGGKNEYTPSELEKNIKTKGVGTKYGHFMVFVENNNEVPVDLEIEVEFYDKEGNLLGSSEEILNGVGANTEIAQEIYSYDVPKNYHKYEIYVDVENSDELVYIDQVSMTHNATKNHIAVQVKNNSEEEIENIEIAIVYYKKDEIVAINSDYEMEIKPGRNANFEVIHPYDDDWDDIKFDTYKVYVNTAYTYDW